MTDHDRLAGYAAVISTGCYGYGETREEAVAAFLDQIAGATAGMRMHMRDRLELKPLDADQASEVIEMLAAPWPGMGA